MGFKVGNRRRVRFCLDKWCGNEHLGVLFPSLVDIAIPRNA